MDSRILKKNIYPFPSSKNPPLFPNPSKSLRLIIFISHLFFLSKFSNTFVHIDANAIDREVRQRSTGYSIPASIVYSTNVPSILDRLPTFYLGASFVFSYVTAGKARFCHESCESKYPRIPIQSLTLYSL